MHDKTLLESNDLLGYMHFSGIDDNEEVNSIRVLHFVKKINRKYYYLETVKITIEHISDLNWKIIKIKNETLWPENTEVTEGYLANY
jgi:hypothetical protein